MDEQVRYALRRMETPSHGTTINLSAISILRGLRTSRLACAGRILS